MGIFMIGFPEIAIILIWLAIVGFEVAMIVHALRNKQSSLVKKIAWTIVIIVFNIFGALYYFFTEYRSQKTTLSQDAA
jgi:heme/copper-type cytochrome/quinol oxidase subunit 2